MEPPKFGKIETITESYFDGKVRLTKKVIEESIAIKDAGELLRELTSAAQMVVSESIPRIYLELHDDRAGGRFIRLVKKRELR